jgi:hypothetical protein
VQQWEEARSTLEEAEAMAETLNLGPLRVAARSQLCMHYVLTGEWDQAYHYALEAIAARRSPEVALIPLDFSFHYETEALLRGGDERQAREAVQRLGERLGPYQRYRLPYLRSLAVLAAWEGLAEGIGDEALRMRFLAGPQIQPVVQHARDLANLVLQDGA